jgi:hypothetical protein
MVTKPTQGNDTKIDPEHAKIIGTQMPGWRIVPASEAARQRFSGGQVPAASDMASSSLADMKRKYETGGREGEDAVESSDDEANAPLVTHVLTVESPSGERKTVGIRDGKISFRQG